MALAPVEPHAAQRESKASRPPSHKQAGPNRDHVFESLLRVRCRVSLLQVDSRRRSPLLLPLLGLRGDRRKKKKESHQREKETETESAVVDCTLMRL